MKFTAIQRRILLEDGVLDYKGPNATKATPDAIPHGTFPGISDVTSKQNASLLDRVKHLLKKHLQRNK